MQHKTLILASLVGALGIASAASADRGYGSRGGDRYAAQRYEASVRYDRGSRNYAGTYERYGQARYDLHTNYDRDYGRRYRAEPRHYGSNRSTWSFGFSSGGGYRSDSFYFGYSSGPRYYTPAPRYYAPPVYYAPPAVYRYDYVAPRAYYAPSYYGHSYGGYYCR